VNYAWQATTARYGSPPRRFDPDATDFVDYPPRFRLYDVRLELRRAGQQRVSSTRSLHGNHAQVRGFTLIELLIALTIFRHGHGHRELRLFAVHAALGGRLGRFQQVQDRYQRLDLVVASLENTLPTWCAMRPAAAASTSSAARRDSRSSR